MTVFALPTHRVALAVLTVVAMVSGIVVTWRLSDGGTTSTIAVTTADGGALDLGPRGTVRIPPGGVDRDATLRVRTSGTAPADPDRSLIPHGQPIQIDVDGARLTAPATLTLPVEPPPAADPSLPFTPLAMYFDETAGRWVPAEGSYDPASRRLSVQTTHFSWWRAFSVDWSVLRDLTTGLLTSTFGLDTLAGAVAPSCAREAAARTRARSQVTGGDNLLWCLDLDADDQLVLRVVNNRRMAVQVQLFPGTTLAARDQRPLSLQYLGPIVDEWLAAQGKVTLVVLGPRETATFRVTSLARQTGVGTMPSAVSYLTDVLDIGVEQLSWMVGKLGSPAASSKQELYRTLFRTGELTNCLSSVLTGLPVLTDPGSAAAIGRSLGDSVLGCLSDQLAVQLPALAGNALGVVAAVGSVVKVGLRMLQGALAGGEYLVDLVSGRVNFFVTLAAPGRVGKPPVGGPTTTVPTPVAGPQPDVGTPSSAAAAPTTVPIPAPTVLNRTATVGASQPWTDTGVDLEAGSHLYIRGSGAIRIAGSDPGKQTNGETVGAPVSGPCSAPSQFTAPGLQCYGMIARIGSGSPFDVLAAVSLTAETSGRLYLGANDDIFGDNSGAWQAAIRICPDGTLAACVAG